MNREKRYRRIRNVAVLMDGALRVPGTGFRFGLNSLVGLAPGAGDALLTIISLWIVWQGKQLGIPRHKLLRMVGNVAVETVLGGMPLLGDLLDVVWKANLRNLAIIDEHLAQLPQIRSRSTGTRNRSGALQFSSAKIG